MDDEGRHNADEDDEISESAEESGPLGRLLEHRTGSSPAEPEGSAQLWDQPSEPSTVSTEYAEGTREHDDDRGE